MIKSMSVILWSSYMVHIFSGQLGRQLIRKIWIKVFQGLSPITFLMALSYLTFFYLTFELCNYQVIYLMFRFLVSKNCNFYIKFNSSGASTHSIAIAHLRVGLIKASTFEFLVILFWGYKKRKKLCRTCALKKKLICAAGSWLFLHIGCARSKFLV